MLIYVTSVELQIHRPILKKSFVHVSIQSDKLRYAVLDCRLHQLHQIWQLRFYKSMQFLSIVYSRQLSIVKLCFFMRTILCIMFLWQAEMYMSYVLFYTAFDNVKLLTIYNDLTQFSEHVFNFIFFRVVSSIYSFVVKDNETSMLCARGCKVKGR